ncbi:SusC/RagA family TonB-linked outer membrane protein [Fulvivirga sp. M361]|uniref:SusC/RagA family TonB-linked outer membrane protein n=1 Tax=Fulvivirga sp. M361 TaxID=2594266 RepID=UPI00117A93DD|nr:SusC/RagA family TonB-linked outer membrane protein [Fulvivirga sp. M361]TRX59915.1 SusC/RagA family TonB-linked outer membrane protein [Fulvivirga sp. M361]
MGELFTIRSLIHKLKRHVSVLVCFYLGWMNVVSAQTTAISGNVTLSDGQSVPGVSVTVEGTTFGTITDANGNYKLSLNSTDASLIFSFIGYQTERVEVKNQSVIDIVLVEDVKELQEIVVTALGVKRDKKALGYATQEVDGQSLVKAREPNVMSSLTGKVAGLVVNNQTDLFSSPQFQLRGETPLIVVDGLPNDTDFWDISPDDIEKITVLKGTTASALYGSIGKDGAIMITTKKGSSNGGGTQVKFNSSTMFQEGFIAIPEVQSTYGAGFGGQYAFVDGKGGGIQDGAGWIWGPKFEGQLIPQFDSPVDPVTGERTPTPWTARGKDNLNNFLRTGLISTNNISVSGGNELGDFRVSASHQYQRGMVPNTDLNNSTFTLSGGYNFSKKLRADASFTYNKQYTDNFPALGYGPQNYIYNVLLWLGTDVDVNSLRDYWIEGQEGLQQNHYNLRWYNNPFFQAFENERGYYKDVNYGQFSMNYDFTDDLSLMVRSGVNWSNLNRTENTPYSFVGTNLNGEFSLSNETRFRIVSDFLLNYSKELSQDWAVRASIGGSNNFTTLRSSSVETDGLNVPDLYNISNSRGPVRGSNQEVQTKLNSLYFTSEVSFLNAVFLGFTGRNDWSSFLPPDNNSFFYPSASLGLVVSDLVAVPDAIPYLKFRTSWAQVRSDRLSDTDFFVTTPTYNEGTTFGSTGSVVFPGVKANPSLKPDLTSTLEIGTDIRFLKNRIGLDVTHYRSLDEDLLTQRTVANSSGFSSIIENAEEKYLRRGWEVVLNATPVKSDAFEWNTTINWSRHRRILEELPSGETELNGVKKGERTDIYLGDAFLRSPGGAIIYDEDSGLPLTDPFRQILGHISPDWNYGITNSFKYKNFSLDVSVDGRHGGVFWSQTIRKMLWGGTHPATVNEFRDMDIQGVASYVGDGVIVTEGELITDADGNVISDTRSFAPNTTESFYFDWVNRFYHGPTEEPNIQDQSFIKLREVVFTYQLPKQLLKRTFIENASISFVGRNLLMKSNVDFLDPESININTGEELLQTPSPRSFGVNLNMTF